MKYKNLLKALFFFGLIFQQSKAQEIRGYNRFYKYEYKGKIDNKYEISLKFYDDKIYEDQCSDTHYGMVKTRVYGSYYYKGKTENIDVIGDCFTWFKVSKDKEIKIDSLNLKEITNDEITGKFAILCSNGSCTGTWLNTKTKKIFSVKLNAENENTFSSAQLNINECRAFFNLEAQDELNVIFNIMQNFKNYILVAGDRPFCLYYSCRGTCCGGSAQYLHLFEIDKNCNVKSLGDYQSDCNSEILKGDEVNKQLEKFKIDPNSKLEIIEKKDYGKTKVLIDRQHLEKGLQVIEMTK